MGAGETTGDHLGGRLAHIFSGAIVKRIFCIIFLNWSLMEYGNT